MATRDEVVIIDESNRMDDALVSGHRYSFLARGGVPQPDDIVFSRNRCESLAVRRHGDHAIRHGSLLIPHAFLPRGHVPESNRTVAAVSHESLAVGREGHAGGCELIRTGKWLEFLAAGHIEEMDDFFAPHGEARTVGCEGERLHMMAPDVEPAHHLAGAGIKKTHLKLPDENLFPVRRESNLIRRAVGVPAKDLLAVADIPQADNPVPSPTRKRLTIGRKEDA
ncbi:MAG TPA: hypothetical protein VG055_29970 [Planctomycetaceae bacterium]|nr:hypothetical protein [Planctomycetaceae bacterium]